MKRAATSICCPVTRQRAWSGAFGRAALLAALLVSGLGADDNVFVSLSDEGWRAPLLRALRAVQTGDETTAVDILQRALAAGGTELLRVPELLRRTPNELIQGLEDAAELAVAAGGRGAESDAASPFERQRREWTVAPGRRFLTVAAAARALLRSLPRPALESYRRRYAGAADRLLEEYRTTGRPDLLERLTSEYALTRAGAEGLETLADLRLEDGRYRLAHQGYSDLLRDPLLDQASGARVRLKVLVCVRLLGDARLYQTLRRRFLAVVTGGDAAAEARGDARESSLSWHSRLARVESSVPLAPSRSGADLLPGRVSRWGGELADASLSRLPGVDLTLSFDSWLWSGNVDMEGAFRTDFQSSRFRLGQRRLYTIAEKSSCFVPLADGRRIFLSGVFFLYRLDGRAGGGRVLQQIPKPSPRALRTRFAETEDSALYTATLWRSDDERLPGLPDEVILTHYVSDAVLPLRYMGYAVTTEIPTRSLVAYDAKTGAMLWKTEPRRPASTAKGDAGSKAEKGAVPPKPRWSPNRGENWDPRLARGAELLSPTQIPADISYTSPAVVRRGMVFVAGWRQEGNVDGVVRALDLTNGETVWETVVCGSTMEHTLFGELAREPFASFLLEQEGVLFYVSNMGAVAALDAADGRLLWVTTYDTIPIEQTLGREPMMRSLVWHHSPPLLRGHLLIVTPRDSRFLYAIDTGFGPAGESRGGTILWRYDNSREDLRDFLGHHAGALYFTGRSGVQALDVSKMDGEGKLPNGGQPRLKVSRLTWNRGRLSGRGTLTAEGVLYADPQGIWLVDFELTEDPRPLLAGGFPESRYSRVPARLDLAVGHVLLTSNRVLSAYTSALETP